MSAVRQWLVDPADTSTPCYITNKPETAQKRADKGDYVVEIERSAAFCNKPNFQPYYKRVKPIQDATEKQIERELNDREDDEL
jgi:hypothetical protein